jgi:hypothetical protein
VSPTVKDVESIAIIDALIRNADAAVVTNHDAIANDDATLAEETG